MKYPSHLGRARRRRLHAFVAMNDQLRYFSSYIRGGVGMMMSLVRLSQNDKVRRIAFAWNNLPRKEHRTVNLDQLSVDAGVAPSEAFDDIIRTAGELSIDCSELLGALRGLPDALRAAEARAIAESIRDRGPVPRATGFRSGRNAMDVRSIAADRDSDLETMEEDTIYWTRMLKQSILRERRREGGNHGSELVGRRS